MFKCIETKMKIVYSVCNMFIVGPFSTSPLSVEAINFQFISTFLFVCLILYRYINIKYCIIIIGL